MHEGGLIQDLAVVLVAAGAAGWICRRLGISLVAGYLVSGALIGPFTPMAHLLGDFELRLVADTESVSTLAQLGLIFLIFSIGLELSFQRLKRLGFSIVIATVIGAVIVYHGGRLFGASLGWTSSQSLFLAGMLMASSSAIISKVLNELNATHHRSSQLALGITVLEDGVAIVMLTLLSTLAQFGTQSPNTLIQTIGALGAFAIFLLLVSLLLVPRMLLRVTESGGPEVRTLLVIGLLLALAWLAAHVGFSSAMGAFTLGVIVASTPQKTEIERVCEGIRDMFGAVFFVAMGMLVDFRLLLEAWPLVIAITLFAVVWRTVAASTGLMLVGNSSRDAIRGGIAVTPLGEFSFIFAQLGVKSGILPPAMYPVAVGASLMTTLISPALMKRSTTIATTIEGRMPLFLREWLSLYHGWLLELGRQHERSVLAKLVGKRLVQTGVQVVFVSTLVFFATAILELLQGYAGEDLLFPHGTRILFWTLFGVFLMAPLVAIWRNFEALAMILAEFATKHTRRKSTLRPLVQTAFKVVASTVLLIWLLALLPFGYSALWVALSILVLLGVLCTVFWRRLIYWHSKVEIELQTQLQTALGPNAPRDLRELLNESQDEWHLEAEEFVVPDSADCAGRKIVELDLRKAHGCSIGNIERHGIVIFNPGADFVIYPQDKLLLVGGREQIESAVKALGAVRPPDAVWEIEDFSLELVHAPFDSLRVGKTLAELDIIRSFRVQVVGIQRGAERTLNPSGTHRLEAGDELLMLGTPRQIQDFREWLTQTEASSLQ